MLRKEIRVNPMKRRTFLKQAGAAASCLGLARHSVFAAPAEKSYDYLLTLPGVGPKTAACVLGFGLGKPAFPVDTHVLRISRRLGLVPEKTNAEKTQKVLQSTTPPEIQMPLHVMMIRHGRNTCFSRKPRCEECPLKDSCLHK